MAVWSGTADQLRRMAVAFQSTRDFQDAGGNLEKRPPGPTVAVLLALGRLQWRAKNFKIFVTNDGTVVKLDEVCPRSVLILGKLAVELWQWRRLAEHYPEEFTGFSDGGDLKATQAELGSKSTLTRPQRELARCAVTRRLWPSLRRAEAGYQQNGRCEACGEELGTLRHALYRCPATAAARHHRDLGPVGTIGGRSCVEHHLFSRGCMPDFRGQAPRAITSEVIEWDEQSQTGCLEGHVFLDGSRLNGDDAKLARAGWGVAMVRVAGKCEARAWGPYPGLIQCIDAAEVHAGTMALKLGAPPLCLYSDSAFFVRGWERGRAWCVAPGRAHADVWKKFWNVAEDFGGSGAIQVFKVKGHATNAMVDQGAVDEVDRFGNDMADEAAKKGAAMHPSVKAVCEKIEVSRRVAGEAARWLGVGLEAAQQCGALPAELTQVQKKDRPQLRPLKRVEIIPDAQWRRDNLVSHLSNDAHQSHSLHKVGEVYFCAVCGCYGAQKLLALASPCENAATPSRRYLLKRMLAGYHPRIGKHLGEVKQADHVAAPHLSASRRRSHSV